MDAKRLEISRLHHRFGFGPKPGQFSQSLTAGVGATRTALLSVAATDAGAARLSEPSVTDLGQRPAPKSKEIVPFVIALKSQQSELTLWWLDRMALTDNPFLERMTWFWHGHWATSIDKLNFSLPMYQQNKTLRSNALGNFTTMARAMLNDGALQFWLDGQDNTALAPNENLAREFMELFVLGVNRYSEDDVKALARIFTGYQVQRSNGTVFFNAKRHDSTPVSLLGKNATYLPEQASDYLVSQSNCAQFISERIWFRFISSGIPAPTTNSFTESFASREIAPLVKSIATSSAMADPQYSIVKSPVEWFIGVARAFNIQPSKLNSSAQLLNHLNKLSQIPFSPPNVGGWPAEEAWLTAASAQFRLAFAAWILKQADLSAIQGAESFNRPKILADLLGVSEWSNRTYIAISNARADLLGAAQLAICSPEYVVSA